MKEDESSAAVFVPVGCSFSISSDKIIYMSFENEVAHWTEVQLEDKQWFPDLRAFLYQLGQPRVRYENWAGDPTA